MAENGTNGVVPAAGWMSDVQRAIALILIGSIAFCTILSTLIAVLVSEPSDAVVDMTKTLQAAIVNMSLIALGFFFGSSMSKERNDISQHKIMEKLTSSPVAPVPVPATTEPWWNRMTEEERAALTAAAAAAPADVKLAAIVSGPVKMKPDPDEIEYLVTLNLLTRERATALLSA